MTPAENWNLVLRLCDLAQDDSITAIRVALLNDFNKPDPFRPDNLVRHLLACLKRFLLRKAAPFRRLTPLPGLPLILIPYATGSNLLNLLPVAHEAKKRRLLGLIVAGEGVRGENLNGFDSVIIESDLWNAARKYGMFRIFQSARRKLNDVVRLLELLAPRHVRRVRQNYGWIFRQLVISEAMRDAFRALLREWRPSCIISTSDYWPFEFQCYCQAKRLNIPTAMIQHGEWTSVTSWPVYADTCLVWGSVFRSKLFELGAPDERVKVCGMPASDAYFNQATTKLLTGGSSPVCLLLSHAHDRFEEPALFKAFGQFFAEVIRSNPHVRFRIKLHPAEDDSFYREQGFSGHKQVEVLPVETPLDRAVKESDVVCTIRSTAGLQAMMMQRPVIVIDLVPGVDCSVPWPLTGGGLAAKTSQFFGTVLDRLSNDQDFKTTLLKSQNGFLDKAFANKGRAAASIVDFLEVQTSIRTQCPAPVLNEGDRYSEVASG